MKLVQQRIGTGDLSGRLHPGVKRLCRKCLRLRRSRIRDHQGIPKSHIGKMRVVRNLAVPPKDILHGGSGLPQVIQIDAALRVQNLEAAQLYDIALLPACRHADSSCHILSKIDDSLPFGCDENFFRRNPVNHPDSGAALCVQDRGIKRDCFHGMPAAGRMICGIPVNPAPTRKLQRGVIRFPVVYFRKYHRGVRPLPTVSGADGLFPSVFISQNQLHGKRGLVSIVIAGSRETHDAFVPSRPHHGACGVDAFS